jgi:hypothetical protein
VVDVTRRADVNVRLVALEFCFGHFFPCAKTRSGRY